MKKRGGKYCNAINTEGYQKGQHCCAKAMIKGPDGKGYCRAHYADVALRRIAVLEKFVSAADDYVPLSNVGPTMAGVAQHVTGNTVWTRYLEARAAVGKVKP